MAADNTDSTSNRPADQPGRDDMPNPTSGSPTSGSNNTVPPGGRRRPAPTIDLKATEVESRPVAWAVTDDPAAESTGEPAGAASSTGEAAHDNPPPPPESLARGTAFPSWQPIAAGLASGVVGALLVLVIVWLSGSSGGDTTAMNSRLARIEAQVNAPRPATPSIDPAKLDELGARLNRIETAVAQPRASAPDPALANRLAVVEETLKVFNQNVADLNRRGDEINAGLREVRERIDSHSSALAELARKAVQGGGVERSEVDALLARLTAVEAVGRGLKEDIARSTDRPARLAVAASNLREAVERGAPFAAELTAVKSLGAPAASLTPLESFATSGLPSSSVLAREFSALTPELMRLAGTTTGQGGILDKLQANAERLVRIRPVDEPGGDDPRSLIARAELRAQTDPAAALTELNKLPPAIRAPAAAWAAKVEARNAALAAARRVADSASTALTRAAP